MTRFFRIWFVLAITFLAGKIAFDVMLGGALDRTVSAWIAIPIVSAVQSAVLTLFGRSPGPR